MGVPYQEEGWIEFAENQQDNAEGKSLSEGMNNPIQQERKFQN